MCPTSPSSSVINPVMLLEPRVKCQSLSCVRFCNPMDCSPTGSSVLEILQAIILEQIAIPFPSGSSRPRDQIWVFLHCRQILYHLSNQGSPSNMIVCANQMDNLEKMNVFLEIYNILTESGRNRNYNIPIIRNENESVIVI